MKPRMIICRIAAAVGAACLFVSCDRPGDPGIKEKVALLEAELRSRDAQLALMQAEIATKPAAEPASAGPDLQAASGAYLGFVGELRKQLAAALPGAKFERTSVFPVVGPDPLKPITSSVAFRVVRQDGKSGEISIPLSADASGKWLEPEASQISEITANFKAKPASTPPVAPGIPAAQPAAGPAKTKPADVLGANRTVEVNWGDASPPPQGTTAGPAPKPETPPPSPPAPSAPVVPKKVMPTSRDVIIDFD